MSKHDEYVLTEWGCLFSVLTDYGIDISGITPRMGEHMVQDFLERMCNAGYVKKREEADDEQVD